MRTKPESSRKLKVSKQIYDSPSNTLDAKGARLREITILRDTAIQDAVELAKMQDSADNKMSDSEGRSIKVILQKERDRLESEADDLNAELPKSMRLK